MVSAFGNLGSFGGLQDQFLGDLAHLLDDFIQCPVVGNGPLTFFGLCWRIEYLRIKQRNPFICLVFRAVARKIQTLCLTGVPPVLALILQAGARVFHRRDGCAPCFA